ncbi:MAG: diguanylate cyclase [Sulfurimonas sp.]|nr:diguanylate cyclase [Sulfurimonas sp.]
MKSFNTQYENEKELKEFVELNNIFDYENILVQVFTGIVDEKHSLKISSFLQKLLPHSHILGVTTSGEINGHEMREKTTLISISVFEKTKVRSKLYKLDESFKVDDIKKDLIRDDTKALIIFSDGLKSDAENLLKDISSIKPDMLIAGGRAGDVLNFKKTYVFDSQEHSEEACIIASLSSDELIANSDYLLNWVPVGKDMIVTKAKGNILYEIDNTPIREIYIKYLGSDVSEDTIGQYLDFPFIIEKDGVFVARSLAGVVDEGLTFSGNFEEGDMLRFSIGNMEAITSETAKHFRGYEQIPAQSIFIYSCIARKVLLGDKLEDEMNMLNSLAPSVGFFTYGEYFHSDKIVELLNVTTTFLALSETPQIKERKLKHIEKQDCDIAKKVLTHLVLVTTEELENISSHDPLTKAHNRAAYLNTIGLKLKSAKRYKESFGIMLIDIDHFKLVNDNYGHTVGDDILKKLAVVLKNNMREDDFVARWGGEEFVVIANYMDAKNLEKLAIKLQKIISETSFAPVPKLTVSFGLSTYIEGDSEESLFRRVDNAMYAAKKNGRNTYIFG